MGNVMEISELREYFDDESKEMPKQVIKEGLEFFIADSDKEAEFIGEFIPFYFRSKALGEYDYLDELHLCAQKYLSNIANKYELRKLYLFYLYMMEVEYYSVVSSYSECIRCINKMLELEGVSDYAMASVLAQAVDIFINCGLYKEAENYAERLSTLTKIAELKNSALIILDSNLMYAYAVLGIRNKYEYHRRNLSRYPSKDMTEDIRCASELFVLGSEAIIDSAGEPSAVFVSEFCNLMEKGSFSTSITASFSEVMVPIVRWVRDKISTEKLIRYMVVMIECANTIPDKLDMYKVLVDEIKVERPKYNFIYEDYYEMLAKYYENTKEIRRHEVKGEMMSHEVELQYRKKALTDELTGIGNRAAYESEIENIKESCVDRNILTNLTVIAMDVNGLKAVNDNFGHQAGDDFIIGAAHCARDTIGQYGHVFRTGGDEFSAIVIANSFPVDEVISELRSSLAGWNDAYGNTLSMSIGVACWGDHTGKAIDELITIADEAMYKDKSLYYQQTGKDRRTR